MLRPPAWKGESLAPPWMASSGWRKRSRSSPPKGSKSCREQLVPLTKRLGRLRRFMAHRGDRSSSRSAPPRALPIPSIFSRRLGLSSPSTTRRWWWSRRLYLATGILSLRPLLLPTVTWFRLGARLGCATPMQIMSTPALPTSTSYLKLVDVPFFTVGDARITPDGVMTQIGKSGFASLVVLQTPARVVRDSPKSIALLDL
jgi:hypothetical protein